VRNVVCKALFPALLLNSLLLTRRVLGYMYITLFETFKQGCPEATSTGSLDLSGVSGSFQKSWYNPRTGAFEGATQTISGGDKRSLGTPPSSASADWVVLVQATG
jgi:hypothetical protein